MNRADLQLCYWPDRLIFGENVMISSSCSVSACAPVHMKTDDLSNSVLDCAGMTSNLHAFLSPFQGSESQHLSTPGCASLARGYSLPRLRRFCFPVPRQAADFQALCASEGRPENSRGRVCEPPVGPDAVRALKGRQSTDSQNACEVRLARPHSKLLSWGGLLTALVLGMMVVPVAEAQSFEFAVRHHHLLRDCRGTLKISAFGVEYQSSHPKDARKWKFEELQTIEVNSPSRISLVTYEDQKRYAGKDRVFEFELLTEKAKPELSMFLLQHVKRPMVLSVLPAAGKPEKPKGAPTIALAEEVIGQYYCLNIVGGGERA